MPPSGDNRSVTARDITGSSVTTGDHNTVTTNAHVTLPPAHTVDVQAELAALREILAKLQVPESKRLDRALDDAEEETAKPTPDKEYVSGALGRALKVARGANDFAEQAEKITPRLTALAGWIGPAGQALLSLLN